MGNTIATGRGSLFDRRFAHAVARDVAHGRALGLDSGVRERAVYDDGARDAVRHQPQDGLQVARALRQRACRGLAGSIATPPCQSTRDRRHAGAGAAGVSAPSPAVGCEEVAGGRGASPTRRRVAEPFDGLHLAQAARIDRGSPPPRAVAACPRVAGAADHGGQPSVDDRFQRGISHRGWPVLLSVDVAGRLQPVRAAVRRVSRPHHRADAPPIRTRVPGLRIARADPQRQWGPVRQPWSRSSLATQCLVDALGDRARADRAWASRTKRFA